MDLLIREKAKEKGLSLNKLAEGAKFTPQMLQNYLNGTHSIPLDKLQAIASILKVDIMELIKPEKPFEHIYTGTGIWLGVHKVN